MSQAEQLQIPAVMNKKLDRSLCVTAGMLPLHQCAECDGSGQPHSPWP